MRQDAAYQGVSLPEIMDQDALFTTALISPKQLLNNKERVIQSMMSAGATRRAAEHAITNAASGDQVKAMVGSNTMREHGVFQDPSLSDIFEHNVFVALENLKHKAASRISEEAFLGENGKVLANLLQAAKDNGDIC